MAENINCFVFRTDSNAFVKKELREGRLRQGWSPQGTSLVNATTGNVRERDEWKQAYKDAWQEDPSPRRYGLLRRMLDMKKGDLVFCPKVPEEDCFTIVTVSEKYRFEMAPGKCDFGHIIPVEKNQTVVKNWDNVDARTIHELFDSAYFWSPVTQIQDHKRERVLKATKQLLENKNKLDTQPQDRSGIREQRFAMARQNASEFLMKLVNESWGHDQFEDTVRVAFEEKGYEHISSKNFQKGGADADHVFVLPVPGFKNLDVVPIPRYLLLVQVKHKQGEDPEDRKGVEQLIKWKPTNDEDQVAYRILFSSAPSFTEQCKNLAETHNVLLLCGLDAGLFLL